MRRRTWVGMLVASTLAIAAAPTAAAAQADRMDRRAASAVQAAERAQAAGLAGRRTDVLEDHLGRVLSIIDGADPAALERAVVQAGGAVDRKLVGGISAWLAPAALPAVGRVDGVTSIRPAQVPVPHDVSSEGIRLRTQFAGATNAVDWHQQGFTGAGVKVGVIDIGFEDYEEARQAGDLPSGAQLVTRNLCPVAGFENDEHGTAVAEIVYDMAPGATLYVVCVESDASLQAAVDYLAAQGVKIVNMSLGFTSGRGDGSGSSTTPQGIVRRSRIDHGMLWSVAAGNHAKTHYSHVAGDSDGDGFIEFNRLWPVGSFDSETNLVAVAPNSVGFFDVRRDAWVGARQDMRLRLWAWNGSNPIALPPPGDLDQISGAPPLEFLAIDNRGSAQTALLLIGIQRRVANGFPRRFDIFGFGPVGLEEGAATPAGSITEPASSPYALAVGAHCYQSAGLEPFSSQGPTIDGRVKPDISGPDGVSTLTYGTTTGRASETTGFFGTSAAAPHVAGAAALLLGAAPEPEVMAADLDAAELQSLLETNAVDAGPAGQDNRFGFGLVTLPRPPAPLEAPIGDLYVGVDPPVRVIDTRRATGCGVSPCGALGPQQQRTFTVAGRSFDEVEVPADATAVVFNVTAVSPTATGFVTVYPTGQARPTVANLNTRPGQTRPNHVTATMGDNGQITFYNAAGHTHLVFDLAGYYSPSEGEVGLVPLNPPGRAMDTRDAGGALGPGETRTLQIAGQTIGGTSIPSSARAAVLNVTVTQPTGIGFITVWPGGDRPLVASLNFVPHQTVPNLVVATLGEDGSVSFYNSTGGSTHLVVDVMGFYDDPSNPDTDVSRYVPINPPRRNLDTRSGNGLRLGALTPNLEFDHQTRLLYGVPDNATAALMNITVAVPTRSGFLTVFPDGVPRPLSANLNFLAGEVVPNAAISSIGASGSVTIYNGGGGSTHVIVDLGGYFVPAE